MSARRSSTALAAILALGCTPLMAQTASDVPADAAQSTEAQPAAEAGAEAGTTEGAADQTPEATAEEADSSEDAATGESAEAPAEGEAAEPAAPEEPQLGSYYERESHQDWSLRCIRTESGADPCELYQLMRDGQGNSVAEITLIPLQNGAEAVAGATIVSPLETDLTAGLALRVDSAQPKAYPFNFCAPVGCVSRVGLTEAELNSLKRGNQATVSLLPYGATPDQVVELPLSLTGFTAGYTALETAVTEMRAQAEAETTAEDSPEAATPAAETTEE
ncbi:invasion associated locus B family protein [Paracoccus aerodenitrificans]|uniref:invasion associated locus B family protein n=1 Tax=Paracoccus aerodenitrificans TaxID=3017781 RepID=UPI0022F11567|nr:invasion associated locus B family protein [Paracoccus aerodenitrificans]WBU65506.1 invasion associated locus B family protein [Paracoccus aerodenitrificans]